MSPASNYNRLLAKFKLTLPIGTSEICNYLLRMRKTVQRKDYITHCLQVILNAYMRCVGKIGQLVPQKHEITFCACAKRFRGSITSHVACMLLHTSTCEISAMSANWFLRNMKLPSAHAQNGQDKVLHHISPESYHKHPLAKKISQIVRLATEIYDFTHCACAEPGSFENTYD